MPELTKIKRSNATGSAALAHTITANQNIRLLEVRLHLSAASATVENLTATLDSLLGAAYDAVLDSQDMNGLADYVFRPASDLIIYKGDDLDFAWANTNARTFGLEVLYQEL